ncbi:MAG: hypothetical protein P4L27_07940 [Ignavibacteriaceae bacterium]|nr:hypothetical protein [Ignavibacteriaceae bacterium]
MRYIFVLMVSLFLWGASAPSYAQLSISFNLGVQPVWGPTGYDYVENYYMPDIDVYYNVPTHRYYYDQGGRWIYSSRLPSRYGSFDLYNSHKVVINERNPWMNNDRYRNQYASYKGRHDQTPIRDSKDSKYFVNPGHPQHNVYIQQQKHDNGNHFGQKKGTVAPKGNNGNNRSPVIRQGGNFNNPVVTRPNTRNQRPAVVKQNNGNKGNNGKGNGNGNGNDKGKGNEKGNGNNGNGRDK